MTKTFKELQEVDQLVASLYAKDKVLSQSKFGYAYKRFSDKFYFPVVGELKQKLQDIRVDNAMEDKNTKEILVEKENVRGFKYTKEGLKNCIKQERELFEEYDKKEIEFEPFISSYVPEGLTEDETLLLKGVLIAE
ncbi:MAG TPA: hypothetical protein VI795_02300 [Patescibacteria group bacterium]|nr:hypothetical protein [Patescibacteria group bacterium]